MKVGLLFLVFLLGCAKLVPDRTIPAVKVGYPTLEFQACEKRFHGLGICSLTYDEPYNLIQLKVQGYYKGTGRVYSNNCNIDQSFHYSGHELIPIEIEGIAKKNCLISVTLSPEYPKQEKSGIAVYSFRGHLAIKVKKKNEPWKGTFENVTGNWEKDLKIDLGVGDEVRVIARGCNIKYDEVLKVEDGILTIPLHDVVKIENKGQCVLEGVVIDPVYEDYLFTVILNQYRTRLPADEDWYDYTFTPLAPASLNFKEFFGESKLEIEASGPVSVIGFDEKYKFKHKWRVNFNKSKVHIIRL